jgi:membrane protein insertase Oxa1/YidC/SpoIIIJ
MIAVDRLGRFLRCSRRILFAVVWLWPGRLSQAQLESALRQLAKEFPDPSSAELRKRQLALLKQYEPAMRSGWLLTLTKLLHAAIRLYVFAGLYFILTYAPDLRGVPLGWVPDLTQPDSTYGLPLIILAVRYILGAAVGGEDTKRRGLYLLTVVGWAFLHVFLPAGMALYHLCSFFTKPRMLMIVLIPFGLTARLLRGWSSSRP